MYFRQIYGTAEQLTEKGFFVGVIKRASQAFRRARVVSELQFFTGAMQKAFFKVLRCASALALRLAALQLISRAGSAAQGKGSLFLYPALTSQQGARTAPCWLDPSLRSRTGCAGRGRDADCSTTPHRSGLEELPHPALASSSDGSAAGRVRMTNSGWGKPAVNQPLHPFPRDIPELTAPS